MMIENIRLAFQGIFSHKLRSFLTMLGVIIGIASIIAIVSTIQGTNEQIMQNLIGAGNNAVTISLRQGDGEYYMDSGLPTGVTPVTDEQKESIRKIPAAADATFYVTRSYVDGITSVNASLSSGRALGIDTHYLSTCGYEVYSGRPFTENDYKMFHKVLLLDETAAGILFPDENPIGKIVEVRSEPFTVVGLIRKADKFQPVIESYEDYVTYTQEAYGMVLMPDASWPIVFLYDEPENCSVRAVRTEDMSSVGRDAESIMNESVAGDRGYILSRRGPSGESKKQAGAQREHQQSSDLGREHRAARRRYRRHEYYACIRHGENFGDRSEESNRCQKEDYSFPVPHRVCCPDQHGRGDRRSGGNYSVTGHFTCHRNAGIDIGACDYSECGIFNADRHRVRDPAVH